MNCASEISQLRKAGQLEAALAKSRTCYGETPGDIYLQRAYGWVIYGLVKREVEALENNQSSPGRVANRFNEWLAEYRQFGENERPGMLHSLLLNQVLKGSRAWPGFLEFARWWGPEFLSDDDRKPYVLPNGKAAPSLALRFYYAIGREVLHQAGPGDAEVLAWAEHQVTAALAEYPDDQWLHYYQSKWLLDQGQIGQARDCLMPVVRRQQRAPWIWTLLGQTFEAEDPEKSITCYFRAVQLATKPMEVANTRIALARLLAFQQRFDDAALQVRRALEYRTENDYKVPQELQQLLGASWYRDRSGSKDLPREPNVAEAAELILQVAEKRPIDYRPGIIDNQNPLKSLAHVAFSVDEGAVLHYKKFRDATQLTLGQIVEVGFFHGENRACRLRMSELEDIPGFCGRMEGELSHREGQSFGFLVTQEGERVFVHPDLMVHIPEGRKACIAMMGKDKQGNPGWRALHWIREST
jgi:hypothetical protein